MSSAGAADGFLAMEAFATDARSLDLETFSKQHGLAFLVRLLDAPEVEADVREDRTTAVLGVPVLGDPAELAALFAVYPVRWRSARGSGPITVGRSLDADISVGDVSVNEKHAEILLGADGSFAVLDKGSTEGTSVDSVKVETGVPTPIPPGKTVEFGSVRFTFLPTAWFMEFVTANVASASD